MVFADPPEQTARASRDAVLLWEPGRSEAVPVKAGAGQDFTVLIRVQGGLREGNLELARLGPPEGPFLWRMAIAGVGPSRALSGEVRVPRLPGRLAWVQGAGWVAPELKRDVAEGIFRVAVPTSLLMAERPHEIILRRRGPVSVLELFVDGVLVDAEWPIGLARAPEKLVLTVGAREVRRAIVWGRALADEEVLSLGGGAQAVERRKHELYGPDSERMPYWRPWGFNTFAGDCMPFVHDGRLHLFYLIDRRHHASRWWYGAHQWAHISSTDLKSWIVHPLALPLTQSWEGSICTGSVIFHQGRYHAFYDPRPIGELPGGLGGVYRVPSADGVTFDKMRAVGPLAGVKGGDAEVFWSEPHRKFFLVTRGDDGGRRQFFFYSGRDLDHWQPEPCPWDFAPDNCDCPHYFVWNGRHYFLASKAARRADRLEGPWTDIPRSSLGVPKTVPWNGGRRLIFGFLGEDGWGGDAILHELVALADGTLGEKFVPELMPAAGKPAPMVFVPRAGKASSENKGSGLAVTVEEGVGMLSGAPRRARITMTLRPDPGVRRYGVRVRAGKDEGGIELRIDPAGRTVQWVAAGTEAKPAPNAPGTNIAGLDRPFRLELILGPHGLVDACIEDRHAILSRGPQVPAGDQLFLFAEGGRVTFQAVEVRPLLP